MSPYPFLITLFTCSASSHDRFARMESQIACDDGFCASQSTQFSMDSGEIDDVASLLALPAMSLKVRRASKANRRNDIRKKRTHNFCQQGRVLPSLYVLGAQKSASTSLSFDFRTAGVHAAVRPEPPLLDFSGGCWEGTREDPKGNCWEKELHFWDTAGIQETSAAPLREQWRSLMPQCTGDDESGQRVVGDLTPNNMRMTPLPEGTMPTGFHYSSWYSLFAPRTHALSLPQLLLEIHGQAFSRKLVFVILLRDPISRMQSAFYAAQNSNFTGKCADCNASNFSEALVNALEAVKGTKPQIPDWVWTSMYGHHVEEWFKYFAPDQFAVVPFHKYTANGANDICKYVSSRLDFDMNCSKQPAPHKNTNSHAPLDEDVAPNILAVARDHFVLENQRLAKLLAGASSRGIYLPGLASNVSEAEVAEWLEQNW